MPFLDLRGHVFNDGKIATNVGLGIRQIAQERVYGFNAYYDYRNTKRLHYNQVGFGLETLGKHWDFRINAYFPIRRKITDPYHGTFAGFSGNNLMLLQKYQFAMRGFNAELGTYLGTYHHKSFDLYAAVGPYYFHGKLGGKIWGGKARVMFRFNKYVTLEFSNSYDKMFHNRFQCQLTMTMPFGCGAEDTCCDTTDILLSRMVEPVVRQEIIVVGHAKANAPAINPETGNPYNFVFVDNTSHSLGTYESPYPTLALAQFNSNVGDIIYVFPGDGTTRGMDKGIVLKRNQMFWGSGNNHSIQTDQGNIIIPALSTTIPTITNTTGAGITLDAINQVSGFTLANVFDKGITSTNAEIIQIEECTIDNSQSDQIHLEYPGSSAIASLNSLNLTNGQVNGIFIDSTASSNSCTINNCTFENNLNGATELSFANQTTLNFTNNTVIHNQNSFFVNVAGPASVLASGNIFNNNTSIFIAPISITAGASPFTATCINNIMADNECSAIQISLNGTSSAQLIASNNTITNNRTGSIGPYGASIVIQPIGSLGDCSLEITKNTFSNNVGSPFYSVDGGFNDFQLNIADNICTHNGGSGFSFGNNCNTLTLTADNNIITQGTDHGITINSNFIGTANLRITNNQISYNTNFASAIALGHDGNNLNFIVTGNNLSNNATSGIILYPQNAIENVAIQIENNILSNNQNLESNAAGGVDLEQYTNLSGSLANNFLVNNATADLYIGSTIPSALVCVNMIGNRSSNGYILSNDSGIFNLTPCDVNTVNTGTISTIGTITTAQSCPDGEACS